MKKLLLLLFLFSCSQTGNFTELPSWYLSPPKNNSAYLYGVGSAGNSEEANLIALKNLIEKLSVKISASFTSDKQESRVNDDSIFEASINQDIYSEVQQIEISNYEIDRSVQKKQNIYVLIKVKRDEIFNNYLKELKAADRKIRRLSYNIKKKKTSLEKFANLTKAAKIIRENNIRLDILELIKRNNIITKDYRSRYSRILNKKENLQERITIYISTAKSNNKIKSVIARGLNNINVKVINKNDPSNKNISTLKISSQASERKLYNSYFTKITINFKLIENFGRQISSGKINISGSSNLSSKAATNKALDFLEKKIRKEGLLNIIGL
jgi:hypothetical protein